MLTQPVDWATYGYRSDHPALDGNKNIISCRDGTPHYFDAFAKLLWEVVFYHSGKRNTGLKKTNDMYLVNPQSILCFC